MLMRHQELCVRHQAEVSGLTEELQQERTNRGHLQTILQEAATALTDILKVIQKETGSFYVSCTNCFFCCCKY